jgi:hypothetical protein
MHHRFVFLLYGRQDEMKLINVSSVSRRDEN